MGRDCENAVHAFSMRVWQRSLVSKRQEEAMIDLQDRNHIPSMEELEDLIRNPLFGELCLEMEQRYGVCGKPEFSRCDWERGWNLKFKKSGKSLCVIYPRENYITVMVVVGAKEKGTVEEQLLELSPLLQDVYHHTKEGNGQRWLMIDLEDEGNVYRDVLKLIDIRYQCR